MPTTVDPVNSTTQSVLMIVVVLAISHHPRHVQSFQPTMTDAMTSIVAMNLGQRQQMPNRLCRRLPQTLSWVPQYLHKRSHKAMSRPPRQTT